MKNNLPIYLLTNRNHHWLVPGFIHLFRTFWNNKQPVTIASYGDKDAILERWMPDNWAYHKIANQNYPANQWSNGLKQLLTKMKNEFFVLFLEDYWLNAAVNVPLVHDLFEYCSGLEERDSLLRMDLTADRVSQRRRPRHWSRIGENQSTEIVLSVHGTKYQMSFQCGIWQRNNLLSVLRIGESPWDAELRGTDRLNYETQFRHLIVLGTNSHPVKYRPVYRTGRNTMNISSIGKKQQAFMGNHGMFAHAPKMDWIR